MAFVDASLERDVKWGEAHEPIDIPIPWESWRTRVKEEVAKKSSFRRSTLTLRRIPSTLRRRLSPRVP
jgi:hypothetical protein